MTRSVVLKALVLVVSTLAFGFSGQMVANYSPYPPVTSPPYIGVQ